MATFVEPLLAGRLSRARIAAGAAALGLDVDRDYHALRARLTGPSDVATVERELGLVTPGGRRTGLVVVDGDDVRGFIATVEGVCPGFTAGVSRPVGLAGLAGELRLATRALDAALSCGLTGLLRLEDVGLRAAVVSDVDVTDLLVHRYVDPFRDGEAGPAVLETVRCFLVNGRRPGRTGRDLFVHTNTVRYRLARFEAVTGRSLRDARTMVEVWWALEAHRLGLVSPRLRTQIVDQIAFKD